ncbi:MAG: hypothetical protein NVS1B11_32720 [Terriglobales bacterium]
MAVVIRSPARLDDGRHPHGSVFRYGAPCAVSIKVFGSDHIGRNVTSGDRFVLAAVTHPTPLVETILVGSFGNDVLQGISSREAGLLMRTHSNRFALAGSFPFTFPHGDNRCISVRIYVEAVVAGLKNGECLVWRVHFVDLAVVQVTDMQVHQALVQFELHGVVADIGQGQAAFGINPNEPSSDVQLGAGILVGPDVIRICERTIQFPRNPVVHAMRLDGH